MYAFASFLDQALKNLGAEWTSDDHRLVAENALLGNGAIHKMSHLMECVRLINAIPQDRIRDVFATDLMRLGIPIC